MNIPQTFVRKSESKLKQLLKKPILNQPENKMKKYGRLYGIVKKEFPGFIEYLIDVYPDLKITEVTKRRKHVLEFYINQHPPNPPLNTGSIKSYFTEKRGVKDVIINKRKFKDVILREHGYKAQILIGEKWHNLKYRKGYKCLDLNKFKVISIEDPFRYDAMKDIPFP